MKMRMKERGLGTGAIVAIVVVVVAVVVGVVAAVLLMGGGVAVPVYPGATEVQLDINALLQAQGKSLPAGVDAKVYTYSANTSDIVSWYKTEMPKQGWTLKDNYEFSIETAILGMLSFEKGDQASFVMATGTTTAGSLITVAGPKAAMAELGAT